MGSLLKSTDNTRAILPDSLRFLRSDVPWRISEEKVGGQSGLRRYCGIQLFCR